MIAAPLAASSRVNHHISTRRGREDLVSELECTTADFSAPTLKGPDGHRLNSDYACYFGIGNGVARFTCERIRPLGVHLPPTPMSYDEHVDEAWLVQEGNEVLLFCEDILGRIDNMVGRVKHKLKAAGRTEEALALGVAAEQVGPPPSCHPRGCSTTPSPR